MSKIAGLGDIKKKAEEEAKRNEFFAGGLDQRGGGSGLAVLGPPPSNGSAPGAFDNIVQRASNPSEPREGAPVGPGRVVTMYRNGFTVDDGPLRDLVSPESRAFLQSLERGEAPRELSAGGDVEVHLHDKRGEDYVAPPPPAYVAFSGTAATLGGAGGPSDSGAAVFTEEAVARVQIPAVDDASPVTTLQVKTVQGKKIRIKINQGATVLQLAATIVREGGASAAFSLSAGFPPKDITDGSTTISEAGLLNAAITQKNI